MTQVYDGFVHLGFSNRNGRTISHKKYQEGNSRVSADNSDANGVPYYFLIIWVGALSRVSSIK